MKNNLINIGKIIAPFGIKGEMKVYSESDFCDYRYRIGAKIYINQQEYIIKTFRYHQKLILISLDTYDDINKCLPFIGLDIYAIKEDLPPLEEDEYYIDDLIGLQVYNQNHELLGIINDVLDYPAGMILEVLNDKQKILIPFVNEYIIDINDHEVIIKEIEGLR